MVLNLIFFFASKYVIKMWDIPETHATIKKTLGLINSLI